MVADSGFCSNAEGALAGKGRPKVLVTHGNGEVLRKLPLRVLG